MCIRDSFLLDLGQRRFVGNRRQLLVCLQPQPLPRHVLMRQMRVHRQLDLDLHRRLGPVGVAEVGHGLTDEPHVEVEAHPRDVTCLLYTSRCV